jgi:hypothetical protein
MPSDFERRTDELAAKMHVICEDETYAAVITAHILIAMNMLAESEEAGAPWPLEVQLMLALMAKFCATMREEAAKTDDSPSSSVH